MKKYIDAELEVLSMENDIIATSLNVDNTAEDNLQGDAATRRSIWN